MSESSLNSGRAIATTQDNTGTVPGKNINDWKDLASLPETDSNLAGRSTEKDIDNTQPRPVFFHNKDTENEHQVDSTIVFTVKSESGDENKANIPRLVIDPVSNFKDLPTGTIFKLPFVVEGQPIPFYFESVDTANIDNSKANIPENAVVLQVLDGVQVKEKLSGEQKPLYENLPDYLDEESFAKVENFLDPGSKAAAERARQIWSPNIQQEVDEVSKELGLYDIRRVKENYPLLVAENDVTTIESAANQVIPKDSFKFDLPDTRYVPVAFQIDSQTGKYGKGKYVEYTIPARDGNGYQVASLSTYYPLPDYTILKTIGPDNQLHFYTVGQTQREQSLKGKLDSIVTADVERDLQSLSTPDRKGFALEEISIESADQLVEKWVPITTPQELLSNQKTRKNTDGDYYKRITEPPSSDMQTIPKSLANKKTNVEPDDRNEVFTFGKGIMPSKITYN